MTPSARHRVRVDQAQDHDPLGLLGHLGGAELGLQGHGEGVRGRGAAGPAGLLAAAAAAAVVVGAAGGEQCGQGEHERAGSARAAGGAAVRGRRPHRSPSAVGRAVKVSRCRPTAVAVCPVGCGPRQRRAARTRPGCARCCRRGEHQQVHGGVTAGVGQPLDDDDQPRRPGGRGDGTQQVGGLLVRPVVQHLDQQVELGARRDVGGEVPAADLGALRRPAAAKRRAGRLGGGRQLDERAAQRRGTGGSSASSLPAAAADVDHPAPVGRPERPATSTHSSAQPVEVPSKEAASAGRRHDRRRSPRRPRGEARPPGAQQLRRRSRRAASGRGRVEVQVGPPGCAGGPTAAGRRPG